MSENLLPENQGPENPPAPDVTPSKPKDSTYNDPRRHWRPIPSARAPRPSLWPWVITWAMLILLLLNILLPGFQLFPSKTPIPSGSPEATAHPESNAEAKPSAEIVANDFAYTGSPFSVEVQLQNITPDEVEVQFSHSDPLQTEVLATTPLAGGFEDTFLIGDIPSSSTILVKKKGSETIIGQKAIAIVPAPIIQISIKPTLAIDSELLIAGFGLEVNVSIKDGSNQGPLAGKLVRVTADSQAFGEFTIQTDENGEAHQTVLISSDATGQTIKLTATLLDVKERPSYTSPAKEVQLITPTPVLVKENTSTDLIMNVMGKEGQIQRQSIIGYLDKLQVEKLTPSADPGLTWVIVTGWIRSAQCTNADCLSLSYQTGTKAFYPQKPPTNNYINVRAETINVVFAVQDGEYHKVQVLGLVATDALTSVP